MFFFIIRNCIWDHIQLHLFLFIKIYMYIQVDKDYQDYAYVLFSFVSKDIITITRQYHNINVRYLMCQLYQQFLVPAPFFYHNLVPIASKSINLRTLHYILQNICEDYISIQLNKTFVLISNHNHNHSKWLIQKNADCALHTNFGWNQPVLSKLNKYQIWALSSRSY